jgi:hypothetical protein
MHFCCSFWYVFLELQNPGDSNFWFNQF